MCSTKMMVELDWLEKALFETSAAPRGTFRQAWAMKLMRTNTRSRLPRGFRKGSPLYVGGHATPSARA